MKQPVFIRLANTYDEAMYYRNSPEMSIYNFNGVQLLPNSPYAYTQVASVELENFTVEAYNTCDDWLGNIDSQAFEITPFQDPDTGTNAIYWSFRPDGQQDFGKQLIYLRFKQGNDYIYSSPFYLTDEGSQFTSRWDYWDDANDTVLSTQLCMWYVQPLTQLSLEEYNEVYSGGYTSLVNRTKYERWRFGIIDIYLFDKFADMMQNEFVYCGLRRVHLFKTYDTPELVGRENFAQTNIDLYFDDNDIYDPNYVPYVPTPEPPSYSILLLDVQYGTIANTVRFVNFTSDIPNPTSFIYQYSLDGVTWTSQASYPSPVVTIPVQNPQGNSYYYRIYDPVTGIYSNILQITEKELGLNYVLSDNTSFSTKGNTYRIGFQCYGFTIPTGYYLDVQYSTNNGAAWITAYYQVPSTTDEGEFNLSIVTAVEATKFRLKYTPLGLTSNTATHEF